MASVRCIMGENQMRHVMFHLRLLLTLRTAYWFSQPKPSRWIRLQSRLAGATGRTSRIRVATVARGLWCPAPPASARAGAKPSMRLALGTRNAGSGVCDSPAQFGGCLLGLPKRREKAPARARLGVNRVQYEGSLARPGRAGRCKLRRIRRRRGIRGAGPRRRRAGCVRRPPGRF